MRNTKIVCQLHRLCLIGKQITFIANTNHYQNMIHEFCLTHFLEYISSFHRYRKQYLVSSVTFFPCDDLMLNQQYHNKTFVCVALLDAHLQQVFQKCINLQTK